MSHIADAGLWEVAVLAVLREHPMHPYEMQRLLKERRKDDVLVLKRGSLYHAIRRLAAAGLIVAGDPSRVGLRPERTTYSLTPAGDAVVTEWLKDWVATPRAEPSSFMGAMSFLIHVSPAEAAAALEQRIARLEQEIAAFDERIAAVAARIGRVHVVESEYARAMRSAEATWARSLLGDIRAGRLSWDLKSLLRHLKSVHAERARAGVHRTPTGKRPHRSSAESGARIQP